MDASKITLYSVGIFFILNLVIGLWFGRNVTTIRDFALANKSYGTASLVMTYLATLIGAGWLFMHIKDLFENGIAILVVLICRSLSMITAGKIIYPQMFILKNCLTTGDIMRQFYGINSQILSGIISVLFSSVIFGLQVSCMGMVFEKFLNIDRSYGIIFSSLILIIYSSVGGMKAVTATDIFQFVMLTSFLIIMSGLCLKKLGGIECLLAQVPDDKLSILGNKKIYSHNTMIFLDLFFCAGVIVNPPSLDRILMAKSGHHMKKMLYISAICTPILFIMIVIISLSSLVINPDMNSSNIIITLTNILLPTEFHGLVILGIISIIFSTADSYMHSAGVGFAIDIANPIAAKNNIKINQLKWAKFSTIIIGLIGIWFALYGESMFRLDYLYGIVSPTLAAPLLFGILGVKPEKKAFWASVIAAIAGFIIFKNANPLEHPIMANMSVFLACCVSAVVFMTVHIYINDGIYIERHHYGSPTQDSQVWQPDFNLMFKNFLSYFKLAERCRYKVVKYGIPPYLWFGIVFLVVLSAPYFAGLQEPKELFEPLLYLRFIGIVACALLITEGIWPYIMLRYLPLFWHATVTYCIPFLSTVLILATNGSIEYVISVAVFTMLLIALVDWASAIIISGIGITAGVYFYNHYLCPKYDIVVQKLDFHVIYLLFFEILCATVLGIIFMRKKQDLLYLIKSRNLVLRTNVNFMKRQLHDSISVEERISQGLGMREIDMIDRVKKLESFCSNILKYAPDKNEFAKDYEETKATIAFLEDLSQRSRDYLKLKNVKKGKLDDFLLLINEFASTQLVNSPYSIVTSTKENYVEFDVAEIGHVIMNIFSYVFNMHTEEPVTITISDTNIVYTMPSLPNYEKRVKALQFTISTVENLPKDVFPETYREHMVNPKEIVPFSHQDIEEVISKRIIAAHFGISKSITKDDTFTYIFVIPQKLREIRPLPLDLDLPKEVIVTWPGAIDLENDFKKTIRGKAPNIDISKVDQAIDIIKKYHSHQTRKSGEPYYLHPIHVAKIELDFSKDEEAILGALLHDLLEDTAFNIVDIKTVFGDRVAEIAFGVSKIDRCFIDKCQDNKEHLKTLVTKDFITLSIKIADRIHNMRTIKAHSSAEKRKAVARETLEFFVPLAQELGLDTAASELKRLAEGELGVAK